MSPQTAQRQAAACAATRALVTAAYVYRHALEMSETSAERLSPLLQGLILAMHLRPGREAEAAYAHRAVTAEVAAIAQRHGFIESELCEVVDLLLEYLEAGGYSCQDGVWIGAALADAGELL